MSLPAKIQIYIQIYKQRWIYNFISKENKDDILNIFIHISKKKKKLFLVLIFIFFMAHVLDVVLKVWCAKTTTAPHPSSMPETPEKSPKSYRTALH